MTDISAIGPKELTNRNPVFIDAWRVIHIAIIFLFRL